MESDFGNYDAKFLCFAALTPANTAAVKDFSSLCDELYHQQNSLESVDDQAGLHHTKHIHLQQFKHSMREILGIFEDSSSDGSAHEAEAEAELELEVKYWRGSYVFHLSPAPHAPRSGWSIGRGKPNDPSENVQVDFRIHGAARTMWGKFNFDKNGILRLHARHGGITVGDELLGRGDYIVLHAATMVSFGALKYRFQFTVTLEQEANFQKAKAEYLMKNSIATVAPIEALSVTPSPHNIRIGDWIVKAGLGAGAQGIVDGAVRVDGSSTAAIKVFSRTNQWSARVCETRVKLLQVLNEELDKRGDWERRFVLALVDVQSSNGTAAYDENRPDRIYTFSSPVARCSLDELLQGKEGCVSPETKKQLFTQSLLGVQAIHKAGFMHRDLKTDNIAIVSSAADAPHAIVIDLDSAVPISSEDHGYPPAERMWGTIGFIAPEAENPKYDGFYSEEVDSFSMGCVGYEMFIGSMPWLLAGTNIFAPSAQDPRNAQCDAVMHQLNIFDKEVDRLREAPFTSCENLLGSMMLSSGSRRLRIRDALVHPWLADAVRQIEEAERENASIGQKRKAT